MAHLEEDHFSMFMVCKEDGGEAKKGKKEGKEEVTAGLFMYCVESRNFHTNQIK